MEVNFMYITSKKITNNDAKNIINGTKRSVFARLRG